MSSQEHELPGGSMIVQQTPQMTVFFVSELPWATVVAMAGGGHANVSSAMEEELDEFLTEEGISGKEVLLMAPDSIGHRSWVTTQEAEPLWFGDDTGRWGWWCFVEDDLIAFEVGSATSGATLSAQRGVKGWDVLFSTPKVEEEESQGGYYYPDSTNVMVPYRGHYYQTFVEGLGIDPLGV